MGVISCDRSGCNNVMCDNRSYLYGDICKDCLVELKSLLIGRGLSEFPEAVREFMEDRAEPNGGSENLVDLYLEEEFPGDEYE